MFYLLRLFGGKKMRTKKTNDKNPVISYVKSFLSSNKKELMEYCYYSIKNEEGQRYFKDTIALKEDREFDSLFPLVSLVVITANKIECDSLNYIFSKQNKSVLRKRKHSLPIFERKDLASPDAYIIKIYSSYILHLNAYETGSNTPGGSTDLVRFISKNPFLHPTCIISFGICYGRDPVSQNIGDVLIPRKLYPWSVGQKLIDNNLNIKHDNFNLWLEEKFAESGIYSILNNFCNGEDGRVISSSFLLSNKQKKDAKACNFSIKVVGGNMSTGEAVVSSQKAKEMIRKSANNERELGGEMEGYGIAKECIFYANIPCFIIKAICDWGECKDIDTKLKEDNISCPNNLKDQLQAYAAFCAGIALLQLINDEKNMLLSLKLIEWLGNNKRRNCIKPYNYVSAELFIKNIKLYYKVDEAIAHQILTLLISNKIIQKSSTDDIYFINVH